MLLTGESASQSPSVLFRLTSKSTACTARTLTKIGESEQSGELNIVGQKCLRISEFNYKLLTKVKDRGLLRRMVAVLDLRFAGY